MRGAKWKVAAGRARIAPPSLCRRRGRWKPCRRVVESAPLPSDRAPFALVLSLRMEPGMDAAPTTTTAPRRVGHAARFAIAAVVVALIAVWLPNDAPSGSFSSVVAYTVTRP